MSDIHLPLTGRFGVATATLTIPRLWGVLRAFCSACLDALVTVRMEAGALRAAQCHAQAHVPGRRPLHPYLWRRHSAYLVYSRRGRASVHGD